MDCAITTLHALVACFSWSNLYLDGGISYQDTEYPRLEWATRTNHGGNAIETVTALETVDEPFNPYGRLSLGYEMRFRSVTLAIEASHQSSFELDDRGINSVSLKARWYPFRR